MEAILVIQKKKGAVRCVDVAEQLKVTKPSVSRAVKELEKMGHVSRDEDGSVALTPSGERIAAVDPETAAKEACHMEHGVSEESFQKLKEAAEG